jgi:hypothetical protein
MGAAKWNKMNKFHTTILSLLDDEQTVILFFEVIVTNDGSNGSATKAFIDSNDNLEIPY